MSCPFETSRFGLSSLSAAPVPCNSPGSQILPSKPLLAGREGVPGEMISS